MAGRDTGTQAGGWGGGGGGGRRGSDGNGQDRASTSAWSASLPAGATALNLRRRWRSPPLRTCSQLSCAVIQQVEPSQHPSI